MVTKNEMNESIEKLNTTLTENFKKMLDDSISELKNTIIDNLKTSNELLLKKVSDLENEVDKLKTENIELTRRSEVAFQHGRQNQIIISGIPEEIEHDDLEATTIRVLNKIKDHKINERDVEACHRVGKKSETILRFVNRKDAEDCLSNRKKLANFDREAVGLDPDVNIYVNGNLSPYMNKLAFYCRVLKRRGKIARMTTFKGVIKITMNTGGRVATNVIGHKQDLVKFFPDLDALINEANPT